MSYIEITIGGKTRGLRFGQATHAEIVSRSEGVTNTTLGAYIVIFCGLFINCSLKGLEVDFTLENVAEWADKLSEEDMNKISSAYNSTLEFQKRLPKDSSKKKSRGTGTRRSALK